MPKTQKDQITLQLSAYERPRGISNKQGHSLIHLFVRSFETEIRGHLKSPEKGLGLGPRDIR